VGNPASQVLPLNLLLLPLLPLLPFFSWIVIVMADVNFLQVGALFIFRKKKEKRKKRKEQWW